jgi:hypothetical protein
MLVWRTEALAGIDPDRPCTAQVAQALGAWARDAMGGTMFDPTTPREIPATDAALWRNKARTIHARITQRVAAGGQPTKDQTRDMERALSLAGRAEADAVSVAPAGWESVTA